MFERRVLFAPGDEHGFSIAREDSAIELAVTVPKEKLHNPPYDLLDPLRGLLTILCIVADGEPLAPAVLLVPATPLYESIIEIQLYPPVAGRQRTNIVVIPDSAVPELLDLYQQWPLRGRHKAFDLAQERFNLAGTRASPKDRLIDYWVALEALFMGLRDELRYRASVRLAYFHVTSPEDRIEFARNVRWSYDWRSYVVHGETGDKPRGTVEEASAFAARLVKDSLHKLAPLLQRESIPSIIEKIDRSVEAGVPIF